jgi:hypothetical protein
MFQSTQSWTSQTEHLGCDVMASVRKRLYQTCEKRRPNALNRNSAQPYVATAASLFPPKAIGQPQYHPGTGGEMGPGALWDTSTILRWNNPHDYPCFALTFTLMFQLVLIRHRPPLLCRRCHPPPYLGWRGIKRIVFASAGLTNLRSWEALREKAVVFPIGGDRPDVAGLRSCLHLSCEGAA